MFNWFRSGEEKPKRWNGTGNARSGGAQRSYQRKVRKSGVESGSNTQAKITKRNKKSSTPAEITTEETSSGFSWPWTSEKKETTPEKMKRLNQQFDDHLRAQGKPIKATRKILATQTVTAIQETVGDTAIKLLCTKFRCKDKEGLIEFLHDKPSNYMKNVIKMAKSPAVPKNLSQPELTQKYIEEKYPDLAALEGFDTRTELEIEQEAPDPELEQYRSEYQGVLKELKRRHVHSRGIERRIANGDDLEDIAYDRDIPLELLKKYDFYKNHCGLDL